MIDGRFWFEKSHFPHHFFVLTLCFFFLKNFSTGMIRQFVIDDKGSVLVCVFGCPGSAHEDDAFRAVMTAQNIQKGLSELQPISQMASIGITTGNAFCGIVGQKARGWLSFFFFSFFFGMRHDFIRIFSKLQQLLILFDAFIVYRRWSKRLRDCWGCGEPQRTPYVTCWSWHGVVR
jgi:hypothetical protein